MAASSGGSGHPCHHTGPTGQVAARGVRCYRRPDSLGGFALGFLSSRRRCRGRRGHRWTRCRSRARASRLGLPGAREPRPGWRAAPDALERCWTLRPRRHLVLAWRDQGRSARGEPAGGDAPPAPVRRRDVPRSRRRTPNGGEPDRRRLRPLQLRGVVTGRRACEPAGRRRLAGHESPPHRTVRHRPHRLALRRHGLGASRHPGAAAVPRSADDRVQPRDARRRSCPRGSHPRVDGYRRQGRHRLRRSVSGAIKGWPAPRSATSVRCGNSTT